MLRSNLIGTFVAATALGATANASAPEWVDLQPPEVSLLDPGQGPHHVLRYDVPNASRQYVRRVQSYEVSAKLPLGAGREDEGQLTMVFDVRAVPTTGAPPIEVHVDLRKVGGPQDSGAGLTGSGLVRFDAQGRALQARWDQTPTDTDADAVLIERFHTRVSEMATPLPEQPIGIGGRWRVSQTLARGAGKFLIVADCKLVDVRGDDLDIECAFSHQTDGAPLTVGKGKRKREVKLEESVVDGKSLIQQSLRALAPLREDGDMRTFFEARTKMGLFKVKAKIDTAERWNQVGADRPFARAE